VNGTSQTPLVRTAMASRRRKFEGVETPGLR
jgi:hypothetical protein